MSEHYSSSGGVGFVGLLTIAFIVLKLCGVITWSWLWVFSPMWLTLLFVMVVLLFAGIVLLFCSLFGKVTR